MRVDRVLPVSAFTHLRCGDTQNQSIKHGSSFLRILEMTSTHEDAFIARHDVNEIVLDLKMTSQRRRHGDVMCDPTRSVVTFQIIDFEYKVSF